MKHSKIAFSKTAFVFFVSLLSCISHLFRVYGIFSMRNLFRIHVLWIKDIIRN